MTPFEIADVLRACLDGAFDGDDEKPAEICHRPGDLVPLSAGLAQDECCSGLGWVRIQEISPVIDPLATEDATANPCSVTGRRVTLELGVARCNPTGDANAGPTCDQWTNLALRIDRDALAMRRAACCAGTELVDQTGTFVYRVRGGAWTPLESSGGCAGGTMTVVVWLDCDDCQGA